MMNLTFIEAMRHANGERRVPTQLRRVRRILDRTRTRVGLTASCMTTRREGERRKVGMNYEYAHSCQRTVMNCGPPSQALLHSHRRRRVHVVLASEHLGAQSIYGTINNQPLNAGTPLAGDDFKHQRQSRQALWRPQGPGPDIYQPIMQA